MLEQLCSNSYARSEMFIFSGLSLSRRSNGEKLTRFKLSADKLAGKCFKNEIERQSRYNVVEIEVIFVSTGCDSDKPEKINISLLSGCCLYEH